CVHLLPNPLELGSRHQRLGEPVPDERGGPGRLGGTGQRDHHRGRPHTRGDVPQVIVRAGHYKRSAVTKSENASLSSANGTFSIQRPSRRISSVEGCALARQPCSLSHSVTSSRWSSR